MRGKGRAQGHGCSDSSAAKSLVDQHNVAPVEHPQTYGFSTQSLDQIHDRGGGGQEIRILGEHCGDEAQLWSETD